MIRDDNIHEVHLWTGRFMLFLALVGGAWFMDYWDHTEQGLIGFVPLIVIYFGWKKVPVPCRRKHCEGKAFSEGRNPVTYRCDTCGACADTSEYLDDD